MTLSNDRNKNRDNPTKLFIFSRVSSSPISDLLQVPANCKSVLMREHYDLRSLHPYLLWGQDN